MKVLIVEPGHIPYEKELSGLHDMQAAVGGHIQAIYPFDEPVAVVCNEEGLLMELPFNRSVPGGYGGVFGTFFVCDCSGDDFASLSQEQIKKYKQHFYKAEVLIAMNGNEPFTISVQPTPAVGRQNETPAPSKSQRPKTQGKPPSR